MGSQDFTPWVTSALFPKARRAVLGLLYGNPGRRYYLREVVALTGLGPGHVQRELERLSQAGIIHRTEPGRHVYFQAHEQCPVYGELRELVAKTLGASALLRQALAALSDRISVAFVYGSTARGEAGSASDVDLMVIGRASLAEVVEVIRPIESRIEREINPTVYPVDEFRDKLSARHHFVADVMKGKKIFLVGDEHELAALSGQRLDS